MMGKKSIRDNYDALGGRIYDIRYAQEQGRKYSLILSELKIREADLILDNGCGTGLLFDQIKAYLVGLDLSPELLKTALEHITESTYLVNGDSENLPFRYRIYDKIVSVTVIQNLDEPRLMLLETKRSIKEGGALAFTVLKKAMTKDSFKEMILEVELSVQKIISEEGSNDWIIIAS